MTYSRWLLAMGLAALSVVAANAQADSWETFPGIPGCNGTISDIEELGAGQFLVAGRFSECGTTAVANIALWDGLAYQALGSGVDDFVASIAVIGSDVFVGGNFMTAGGLPAKRIARWDGSGWHAVGSGAENGVGSNLAIDSVNALAVVGTDLYVGGRFLSAGSLSVGHIARWDGTQWRSLGTGGNPGVALDGVVYALASSGNSLFVGGNFLSAGGTLANNVARWDGAWHSLGSGADNGTNHWVFALATEGSNLYVGGMFTRAGTVDSRVARWDGVAWHDLAGVVSGTVRDLLAANGQVYAVGTDLRAQSGSERLLLQWNGASWQGSGVSLPGDCGQSSVVIGSSEALATTVGGLIVGGSFGQIDGVGVMNLARFNGTWSSIDSATQYGLGCAVNASTVVSDQLYVGGQFTQAGSISAKYAARWDGAQWQSLGAASGGVVPRPLLAMTAQQSDLLLSDAGNRLSRWNGLTLTQDSVFPNGQVHALTTQGPRIFAAGAFSSPWSHVMVNDNGWADLGGGTNEDAYSIAVVGSQVYAGGNFAFAGGIEAHALARWDGVAWHNVGGAEALNGSVRAITEYAGELIVGGDFDRAGGGIVNHIARWNGQRWASLGTGLENGFVTSLAVVNGELYAGGNFTIAGGVPAHGIARWDGIRWQPLTSPLGEGVDGIVQTLATGRGVVYLGGIFTRAGGVPSHNVAAWRPNLFADGFE